MTMYNKVKSEWKTYEEMDAREQVYFRIYDGWKTYPCRRKDNKFEYLIETWEKIEK